MATAKQTVPKAAKPAVKAPAKKAVVPRVDELRFVPQIRLENPT
jgi:hypothetical protein